MRTKKHPFFLLEICVALCLSGILMGTLFRSYISLQKAQKKLQKNQEIFLERAHFLSTMQTLFFHIPDAAGKLQTSKLIQWDLQEKNPAIYFPTDLGISLRPDFSGPVYAALQLDKKNQLALIFSPAKKDSKKRKKEILLKGVEKLSFSFFAAKEERYNWLKGKDLETLPSIIKISLVQRGNNIDFAFFLPTIFPIIYMEKDS